MEEQKKFCTNCGSELSLDADVCLKCGKKVDNSNSSNNTGKKKKKGLPIWAIVLIVLGSIGVVAIIGTIVLAVIGYGVFKDEIKNEIHDNYNEIIDNDDGIVDTGTIGDTLRNDEFEITLENALIYDYIPGEYINDEPDQGNEYLVLFFDVTNISDESEYFNSYYVDGYADGYQVSVESFLYNDPEGYESITGSIAPGKSKKGYVAFQVDADFQTFEFIYGDDEKVSFSLLSDDYADNNNSNVS